jgi:hypothetical protein
MQCHHLVEAIREIRSMFREEPAVLDHVPPAWLYEVAGGAFPPLPDSSAFGRLASAVLCSTVMDAFDYDGDSEDVSQPAALPD